VSIPYNDISDKKKKKKKKIEPLDMYLFNSSPSNAGISAACEGCMDEEEGEGGGGEISVVFELCFMLRLSLEGVEVLEVDEEEPETGCTSLEGEADKRGY
jgi:hypothetical protein